MRSDNSTDVLDRGGIADSVGGDLTFSRFGLRPPHGIVLQTLKSYLPKKGNWPRQSTRLLERKIAPGSPLR